MEQNLSQTRRIQNRIFFDDVYGVEREQNFLYFLGNHPHLFQEFTESGYLTNAEMNYICEHFFDYNVDPLTFENEFKREMREALPRYNNMKAIELQEELFELVEDKYTRETYSARATSLAENGTNTRTGSNSNNNDNKSAIREEPMETTGSSSIDGLVSWGGGASRVAEDKTIGSSSINQSDINALTRNGTDNGNSTETYKREGNPVDHINKIWQYLLKPKAINYLTSQLAAAFILTY